MTREEKFWPYPTSAMGQAFIALFERAGVIATLKHFIANAGEGGRDSYPIDFNERTLEELFYRPFRDAVVKAGARSVMTAYNSVDGSPRMRSRNHRATLPLSRRVTSVAVIGQDATEAGLGGYSGPGNHARSCRSPGGATVVGCGRPHGSRTQRRVFRPQSVGGQCAC